MSIGRATIAIFGFLAIAFRLWSSQQPAGVRTSIPDFSVASNQDGIPFHFSREFGLILIRAEVNGSPALFVLDTGSNHTAISSKFVDVVTPDLRDSVSQAKGSGFRGSAVHTKSSLKVGPLVWQNHQFLAMEMKDISKSLGENVDGLLGMDFLDVFDAVVVDLKHHKLMFYPVAKAND